MLARTLTVESFGTALVPVAKVQRPPANYCARQRASRKIKTHWSRMNAFAQATRFRDHGHVVSHACCARLFSRRSLKLRWDICASNNQSMRCVIASQTSVIRRVCQKPLSPRHPLHIFFPCFCFLLYGYLFFYCGVEADLRLRI